MTGPMTQPGWYLDPIVPNTQRYWDGNSWTGYSAPVAPPAAQAMYREPERKSATKAIVIGVISTVVVVALLAALAVPVFFSERKKAVDKDLISDITNASLSLESYYSVNDMYPTTKAVATAPTNQDRIFVSPGNSLTISTDGTTGYCIAGTNPSSNYFSSPRVYDSNKGGLQPKGGTCSTTYVIVYTLP
jgi:type IV pilus assembly protein PilA